MRPDLCDLELILPINDGPSANLMLAKALCLLHAGEIDARQAAQVFRRASEVLYRKEFPQAARVLSAELNRDTSSRICSEDGGGSHRILSHS
jgi:hypothetical protein